MCSKQISYPLLFTLFVLLSPIGQLFAGEKPPSLKTYFDSFATGEKTKISDGWFSPDKGYHLIGSMISTTFVGQLSKRGFNATPQNSQYIGAGMTFSLGLAKEIYDSGKPANIFSWKDLTANCVGILVGVLLLGVQ